MRVRFPSPALGNLESLNDIPGRAEVYSRNAQRQVDAGRDGKVRVRSEVVFPRSDTHS